MRKSKLAIALAGAFALAAAPGNADQDTEPRYETTLYSGGSGTSFDIEKTNDQEKPETIRVSATFYSLYLYDKQTEKNIYCTGATLRTDGEVNVNDLDVKIRVSAPSLADQWLKAPQMDSAVQNYGSCIEVEFAGLQRKEVGFVVKQAKAQSVLLAQAFIPWGAENNVFDYHSITSSLHTSNERINAVNQWVRDNTYLPPQNISACENAGFGREKFWEYSSPAFVEDIPTCKGLKP